MFVYKVVVGTIDQAGYGFPRYTLDVEEPSKSLESVLNCNAQAGWELWHLSLPTSYQVIRDKSEEAPVTLIFRREE